MLQLLKLEKENKATTEAHWKEILDKTKAEHTKKLTEMGTILAYQKKVGIKYNHILSNLIQLQIFVFQVRRSMAARNDPDIK